MDYFGCENRLKKTEKSTETDSVNSLLDSKTLGLYCDSCIEHQLFPAIPCTEPDCHSIGMFWVADISFLAWQAIEEGLEYALENNAYPSTMNLNINGKFVSPNFSWEPAFKIDLGMIFPERAWDTQFRWTYFHTSPKHKANGTLIPLWAFPNTASFSFQTATAKLVLNFNGIDIETGYHPYLTPALSMRFFAGLKVLTIHQSFYIHYSNGKIIKNADTILANTSMGTGPRLGFESKWRLGKGFSFLGSIAGSLPLWQYRISRKDHDTSIPQAVSRDRFWTFRSVLETALGFGWDVCYGSKDQYPFGINSRYELQYFPEQNMMTMLVNPGLLSQSYMSRGDLFLHGATLTFHLGF